MAKIVFTFEDTDEGVNFSADFDPKIEDLEEDADGMVLLTPAQNVADRLLSLAIGADPLPGVGCSGGCSDCPCR